MRLNLWFGLAAIAAGVVVAVALNPVPGVLLIIGGVLVLAEAR